MRSPGRLRVLLVLVAGTIALGLGAVVQATGVARNLELLSVDARFDLRGAQPAPADVVVVGIDDRTFSDYRFVPYPLPRRLHGQVIEQLVEAQARTIVYDIQFTEPSGSDRDDIALVDAVARASGRIVLATTETDAKGRTRVLGGDKFLRELGARAGNAIMPADANGVIRRLPYEVDRLASLPVVAAELATGRRVARGSFPGGGSAWIAFHGPPGTLPAYSFSRVADGKVPVSAFRDKIVVVGATAPSLQDVAATSSSGEELMSGPELQAESISTVLRGFPLREAPPAVGWLLMVGMGAVPLLLGLRLRPLLGLLAVAGAGALFAGGAYLAFRAGRIVPVVVPLGTLAAGAVAVLAVRVTLEAVQRRRLRDAFARFVPEKVVDEVLEHIDDDLRLGGTRRECTVLFSDLRGFTSYTEGRGPEHVIDVLNEYLTEMSDAILDNGGTLISYMGDGIMAVFGAPLEQPDHRDRALAAARDMLARLDRFNTRDPDRDFRMGIGINTGFVMCGNVGSARRLEYTAIGDTTNTASRLEGMTKGSGFTVFVADSTRSGLSVPARDLEFVDELAVRGRRSSVRVWGLRTVAPAPRTGYRRMDEPEGQETVMYQDRLKDVPIFAKLKKKDLAVIAQHADELDVPAGKVLAREGELGHEFFVIESGTAEVSRAGQTVAELGPGDFFGEIALVQEDRRTATVTATSPMALIVMTRADFRAADASMPGIHAAVQEAIEQRMAVES